MDVYSRFGEMVHLMLIPKKTICMSAALKKIKSPVLEAAEMVICFGGNI